MTSIETSNVLSVRDTAVNQYIDTLQSKFRSYTIPSITKTDASELLIQKDPFFQWINTITRLQCDTVNGIDNIEPNIAIEQRFGLVNAFNDANQYHQAASRMTSILYHYHPHIFYSYVDIGNAAEADLLMDFNVYVQPNIAARGAVAQEGIIVDITRSLSLAIIAIIEFLFPSEEINTAISTFGIDPYKLRHGSTPIHSYLYARFLHCVILAAIVPDGIAYLESTISKLDQIPKAITGSLAEIEKIKETVLDIRTQIRLAATAREYPERRFLIAFINAFTQVPEESPVNRAIRNVIEADNANADASALMTKISNSVRQTHMLYGTTLIRNDTNVTGNTNAVIQVHQSTSEHSNVTCTFCAAVNTRLNTTFSTHHHFDACFRRRRACKACGKIPENSGQYHFLRACPVSTSTTPTTAPTETPRRDRSKYINRDNRDGQYNKKRKVVYIQEERNDDKYSSSSSSDDEAPTTRQLRPSRTVKVTKSNNYPMLLLDSGANTNTIPAVIPTTHSLPTSPVDIYIYGIGELGLNVKEQCRLYNMTHYVVHNMEMGVVSINQLCTKYGLRILFLHDRAEISTDSGVHLVTGKVQNGLYVLPFQDYMSLLTTVNNNQAIVKTCYLYMDQHPLIAHTRIVMKQIHQEYIQLLHACMGHPTAEKMISSILAGMELPEIPKNELILRNNDTLCRMIERYFAKFPCIPCDLIQYKRLSNKNIITLYPDPTKPFHEISIDYKPADIISYNGMIGTYVCCCMGTMYGAHYPVKSEKECLAAIEYFISVANRYNWKIVYLRADEAHANFTEEIIQYVGTRGIKANRISAGRQERNFVEKYIDIVFKTYYKIHTSQCLLDASYWPLGMDTAISYQNNLTNSRCTDMSPFRVVTGHKPRIQIYTYGMPVMVNRQKKHFSKTVEYMVDNKLAIVAGIDNDVSHGVRVIMCQSGRSDYYYDLLHPVLFDQFNPQSRQEIQMRFRLPHAMKLKKTKATLNTFDFAHLPLIDRIIRQKPTSTSISGPSIVADPSEPIIAPTSTAVDSAQILHATAGIVPYILIQADDQLPPLDELSYMALSAHEQQPSINKIWQMPSRQRWCNSIIKELTKWDNNAVGQIVCRDELPRSANILPTKFVLTYKHKLTDNGNWIYDANTRLTGRGDLEESSGDEAEYYAPTTYLTTVFTLLALAIQEGWHTTTFDVVGAFLKTPIDEEIYITMPTQILPYQYVIKLNKYLYGLKKANNRFNQYIHSLILQYANNIKVATTDICLYYNDDIRLALFVDDGLLITRNTQIRDDFLKHLHMNIGIDIHLTPKQFLKLELEFSPTQDSVRIHQTNYIKLLHIEEPTYMRLLEWDPKLKYRPTVPLPSDYSEMRRSYIQSDYCTYIKAKPVQKIVGSLIWIIYSTLPELQLVGHLLAKYQAIPTEYDFFMSYNAYLYIKQLSPNPIVFTRSPTLTLSVIADGAHMRNFEPDGMVLGQLGYIILLGNCTIMASSMAALRPTRSAFETEMQAGGVGLTQLQFINLLLTELNISIIDRRYYTDCLSIIKLVNRQMQLSRQVRHFANEIAQLKIAVTGPLQLQIIWIPTGQMTADILTKLKIKSELKQQFTVNIHNGALFHKTVAHHMINMTSYTFPLPTDIKIHENHDNYRQELVMQLQIQYDDEDLNYITEICEL